MALGAHLVAGNRKVVPRGVVWLDHRGSGVRGRVVGLSVSSGVYRDGAGDGPEPEKS